MAPSPRPAACSIFDRTERLIARAAAPMPASVMRAASGAPARICSAWPQPQSRSGARRHVRNVRRAKTTVQGIQAAPASWFHTGTCEASGPEHTQTAAASQAAVRESARARESA
jgi:hypothetical protein